MKAIAIFSAKAEDVRKAADQLLEALDDVKAAEAEARAAAGELAEISENWNSDRLYHAVANEALGLLHDLEERQNCDCVSSLDHLQKEIREFRLLVDLAAGTDA